MGAPALFSQTRNANQQVTIKGILVSARQIVKTDSWIYTPVDFDPEKYDGPITRHPDAARWMLNCLHFRRVTRHLGHEDYVNLHSGLLSLVMGKTELVKPIRDALIAHGLIECDGHWSMGSKALGYRVGPALRGCRWRQYSSPDKRFLKRVEKFKEFVTKPTSDKPQHVYLAEWLHKVKVHPQHALDLGTMDETSREFAVHQVEMIQQGLIRWNPCPYGRFHSNFSSLSRKIRPYLTVEGRPLHEVDLVNSQPYFLSVILLEIALSPEGKNVGSLSDLVHDLMLREDREEEEGGRERRGGLYVFPLRRSVLDPLPPDLRQFARSALDGSFYETFQSPGQSDRDGLKSKVFTVLYGNRHCQANAELGPTFKDNFPTVFSMLDNLKREMGHEWVGRELQRRESSVVIDGLVGELQRGYGHIPIVTVHDSVLTTREHVPTVKALLRQQLARNYFQPMMKDKPSAVPEAETTSQAA